MRLESGQRHVERGETLTLPSLFSEFGVSSKNVRYIICALFVELCVDAFFRDVESELISRRLIFNTTLFLASVFALTIDNSLS